MIRRRDAAALAGLAALILFVFRDPLLSPRAWFAMDITGFEFPWRAHETGLLTSGLLPLWNPYSNFGMPLLGNLQLGTFYPPNLLFKILPFPEAMDLFIGAHDFLFGCWTYLWMRRWGARRAGALAAALLASLGGFTVSWLGGATHIATISWLPALFVFADAPLLFALAAGAMLLAGYPLYWGFGMLAFGALDTAWRGWSARRAAALSAAFLGGIALAGAAFLPGLEFTLHSKRGRVGTQDETRYRRAMQPVDLLAMADPGLVRALDRWNKPPGQPQVLRYRVDDGEKVWTYEQTFERVIPYYDGGGRKYHESIPTLGFAGLAALFLGFLALARGRPRLAAFTAAWSVFLLLLCMGGTTEPTWKLAQLLPVHRVLRNPIYLFHFVLAAWLPLVAAGMRGKRWAPLGLAALAAQLCVLAWGWHPTLHRSFFHDRGGLADTLQREGGNARFFTSRQSESFPMPLGGDEELRRRIFLASKRKLFGVQSVVFRLQGIEAAPALAPTGGVRWLKRLRETRDLDDRLALMRWMGATHLVTPGSFDHPGLEEIAAPLYHVNRLVPAPTRAFWLPAIPAGPFGPPEGASPLEYTLIDDNHTRVRGDAPGAGWVFMSDQFFPGWQARLNGAPAPIGPVFDVWRAVRVDAAGPVELDFYYRPWTFTLGAWLSVLALLGLAWLGFRTARDSRRRRSSRSTAGDTPRPSRTSTPA